MAEYVIENFMYFMFKTNFQVNERTKECLLQQSPFPSTSFNVNAGYLHLYRLKQMEEERLKSADHSPRDIVSGKADPEMDNLEDHISRLIEERDTLLRTGVYSTQDRIIAELDRQIREAMANRKLSNV